MENLKTYEGFLDFFKRTDSEDDKIALIFINRLKKIKQESPYKIEAKKSQLMSRDGSREIGVIHSFIIHFDDASIRSEAHLYRSSAMKDKWTTEVECTGDWEELKGRYIKKLYDLSKKIYKQNIEWTRINKIRNEINPEADLID